MFETEDNKIKAIFKIESELLPFEKSIIKKIASYCKKYKFHGFGHCWVSQDSNIALYRLNHIRLDKQGHIYMKHQYGIYIFTDDRVSIQGTISIAFTMEYSLVSKIKLPKTSNILHPLVYDGSSDSSESDAFLVQYSSKHSITFQSHKKFKADSVEWKFLPNEFITLKYEFPFLLLLPSKIEWHLSRRKYWR